MLDTMPRGYRSRKILNTVVTGLCFGAAGLAILVLLLVLGYVTFQGISAISITFLTSLPKPVGDPGGGMGNAIVGTLMLVAMACVLALPVGVGAGIYLAEYGRSGRLASAVRFMTDVLTGMPSIIVGIFAYVLLVLPFRSFSGVAGAFALAVLMIPTITKATEEILRLVPHDIREAALAVGATRSETIWRVLLPSARAGIMTGVMLAVARASGETAPLLFTAFGTRFWNLDPTKPMAAMPMQIFNYAIAPYKDWHEKAWAGALVLVALVLITSVTARVLSRSSRGR